MELKFIQKSEELKKYGRKAPVYAHFPITWKEFYDKMGELYKAEEKYVKETPGAYIAIGYHNLIWLSLKGARNTHECNNEMIIAIDPTFEGYTNWDYNGLKWLKEHLQRIEW